MIKIKEQWLRTQCISALVWVGMYDLRNKNRLVQNRDAYEELKINLQY